MQIYIGNLSTKITSYDLGQLFDGNGECPSFKFKYYQKDHKRFYYALTSIEPESLAKNIMARCNLKRIKNKMIVLHAYKNRSVFNERREFCWGSKPWTPEERRKVDRRLFSHDEKINDIMEPIDPPPAQAHF